MPPPFRGLVAATHTPFNSAGDLNLSVVETQAARLLNDGVKAVFIGGTTGESASLTVDERLALATRWFEVARGTPMQVVVHVGANCIADAKSLAAHAGKHPAAAIAALTPSYFKPPTVDTLVACCREIAAAAPATPFYYYDIPIMTGVSLPMVDFLHQGAKQIPTLVGLKFTNNDLMSYQLCREAEGGRFDLLWGFDELLLAALAMGARGAVGSTYNFAAPIYHDLIAAFDRGDLPTARQRQFDSVKLVRILVRRGFMASAKGLMTLRGVDVGPPRLPNPPLAAGQIHELSSEIESAGLGAVLS